MLIAAGLGIHLEEVVDLPLRDATTLAERLADTLEARTRDVVKVDDPLSPACRRERRCVGDVAARTGADRLVFVRLIGGVTKTRVIATRLDSFGRPIAQGVVNLSGGEDDWSSALARLAVTLFPEPVTDASDARGGVAGNPGATGKPTAPRWADGSQEGLTGTVPAAERSTVTAVGPWALMGLGVTAGAVGLAFGQSSASARDRIEGRPLSGAEYTDALDQMRGHGTAANVLFGVAVGATVTGLVWLIVR